ncbi:MAG: ankyrin repeat domain-containing protein [Gammaproteobacteria bacterium]|jgi:hypothetical protein
MMLYPGGKTVFTVLVFLALSPLSVFADLRANQQMDELVTMAVDGDNQSFVQTVKQNDLLKRADKDGHTPLFAAMFGEPELIDRVLALGAPLEHHDTSGFTPLIAASMLGYPQAVARLLEHGANLEAKTHHGQTALLMSVLSLSVNQTDMKSPSYSDRHNRWETVIKMLVDKGADVNAVDDQGASALFFAIYSGDVALCRYLIQAGADINHTLPNGVSLLRYARAESNHAIVSLLERQQAGSP